MKKIITYAFSACISLALFSSCAKELSTIDGVENPTSQETGSTPEKELITISATLTDALTKVSFDPTYEGGKPQSLTLAWEDGDKLRVYDHADRTKYEDFVLTEESVGQQKGSFVGSAFAASAYDVEVFADELDYAAQTQPADGSTTSLKYLACATDVKDLSEITFTERSSILAITAKMPADVAENIQSIDIKASADIFNGGNTLTITLGTKGDAGDDDILHFYATLPKGSQSITEGTSLLMHFNAPDTDHTVYTRYIELGATDFEAGKLNTVNVNATETATHAGAKGCDASEDTPYLIGDKYQMDAIHGQLTSAKRYYKMVDDIDMTGIAWTPLNAGADLKIHFDGDGYTLKNITSGEAVNYQSIFGCLSGTVQNLIVDGATIKPGNKNAAVLASHLGNANSKEPAKVSNVTIRNSSVKDATGSNAAILAALVEYDGAEVSEVKIERCVVSSKNYAAGLIATTSKSATISECEVSNTDVSGSLTSGLIGHANSQVTVSKCTYNGGTIKASSRYVGGIVASAGNFASEFVDCHVPKAVIDATSVTIDPRCGGFAGQVQTLVLVKGCTVGTPDNRVEIKLGQPAYKDKENKDIRLLSGGFVGCGYGTFTKNGNVRCAAYVKISTTNTVTGAELSLGGFVGYHQYNTIEHCDADVDMSGIVGAFIGGFCGNNISNDILNCTVSGTVAGKNYTGGFVGYFQKGTIANCSSSASVTAQSSVGGFIGASLAGEFTNNSSTGIVSGATNVGGFAGNASGEYISNYSTGNVVGSGNSLGGFIGTTAAGVETILEKNYATGNVSGGANSGGLVGHIGGTCKMSNCYATGNIGTSSKYNQKYGGLVGYTTDQVANFTKIEISNCYASGNVEASFGSAGLIGRIGQKEVEVKNCVAWNAKVYPHSSASGNWSSAAVVGVTFPTCTLIDNYRNPDMNLTAYWVPDMKTYQHANVSSSAPLIDKDGAAMTDTACASGQAHYPQYPYHGKVETGKTLSQLVSTTVGWSSEIWDFSGDLPVLK